MALKVTGRKVGSQKLESSMKDIHFEQQKTREKLKKKQRKKEWMPEMWCYNKTAGTWQDFVPFSICEIGKVPK